MASKSSTTKILDYLQAEIPSEEKQTKKRKQKRAAKTGNQPPSALDQEALPLEEDEDELLNMGMPPTRITGAN